MAQPGFFCDWPVTNFYIFLVFNRGLMPMS